MKLYSYVVDHDYGFAPNPFFGVCTLATCKPQIREHASVGDYIVGTGCARRKRQGTLVYVMRVVEITTYDAYWCDPRFECKRPCLRGSKKQAFGDNIYHRDQQTGQWYQENSFHSFADGNPNPRNVEHDTRSERVLIGVDYAYWGGTGSEIPARFRSFEGDDICARRGHRVNFPQGLAAEFLAWVRSLGQFGYLGRPADWPRSG